MALDAGTVHAPIKGDAQAMAVHRLAREAHLLRVALQRARVGSFGDVEPPRRK